MHNPQGFLIQNPAKIKPQVASYKVVLTNYKKVENMKIRHVENKLSTT